ITGLRKPTCTGRMIKKCSLAVIGKVSAPASRIQEIVQHVKNSLVNDKVIVTGRVPHSLASEYYSVIDIAPFPRKAWPVCEMVSPMKPLEALSMGKAVLVSSVGALSEMVIRDKTGFVFEKGQISSLAEELIKLMINDELRSEVGKNARSWVQENRTWKNVSAKFINAAFGEV
ncbi:glycosyltransferase family 4 protein, partial [Vreelandella hamiltonii]